MKNIHIILILALGLVVSSCFTSYVSNSKVMGVTRGMLHQDVESILGKPDYRRFDGALEEWEYHKISSVVYATPMTIIVSFIDGRVTGMDTFGGHGRPVPSQVVVSPAVRISE